MHGFPDGRFTNRKRARKNARRRQDATFFKVAFAFRNKQVKERATFPTGDLQIVNERGKTQGDAKMRRFLK